MLKLFSPSSFLSGKVPGDAAEMSPCCLLWFGCMAVHKRKTAEIKVDKDSD